MSVFFLTGLDRISAQPDFYAENFTITDMNGVSHTLYDYLDAGQSVLLELIAPWCGPCIDRHNTGILQGVYANRGPSSDPNDVIIFYIDTDLNTTDIELEVPVNFRGVEFPVCNLDADEYADFSVSYGPWLSAWPHALAILPDRTMREIGIESVPQVISELIVPKVSVGPDFISNCYQPTIDAVVTDADSSYITYSWIEILPDSSATSPPFPSNELQPEVNETGTFMLGARNLINFAESSDIVVVTGVDKNPPSLSTLQDTILVNCFGDTIDLFTDGLFGAGIWERDWATEEGEIVNIIDSTQHHIQVRGSGIYTTTTFSNLNGCLSVLDIVVLEPLPLKLDSVQVDDTIMGAADGEITLFPSGGSGDYSALWNTGAIGLTISGLVPGAYVCTITDELGCSFISDSIYLQLATAIQNERSVADKGISVFPNPAFDHLTLWLPDLSTECVVDIYDLHGRLMQSESFSQYANKRVTLRINDVRKGLYLGRVRAGADFYGNFKFIKG